MEESLVQQQATLSPLLLLVPFAALVIALVFIMFALITGTKSSSERFAAERVANLRVICWLLAVVLVGLGTGIIVEMWRALH